MVVSDGVNTSNVAAAVITVVAVNDPPVLTVDPSATYVENAGPVALSPLATLTDLDNTELSQAVVTITDGMNSDRLTIGGVTGGNVNGISFIYDTADARDGHDRREFAPELPGPAADRRIPVQQRQPDGFRREADADPDVERIGWRGRHDRDDDAQYRRRERCPAGDGRRNRVLYGERGAGRALAGVDRDRRRRHHSRFG